MRRLTICLLSLVMPSLTAAQQSPPQDTIRFSGSTWTVAGGQVKLAQHLGREAALFRNGALVLSDRDFESGTIEFDVATTGHRSFVGVVFRVEGAGQYEHFYLRPHNSGRFDAMQYTPVFNGISAWQLYPQYNASIEIPRDTWMHVRLEIAGSRLRVYVDGAAEPALDVDRLRHAPSRGSVGLLANFPAAGQPADLYPTAFANVTVRPDDRPAQSDAPEAPAPDGTVARWAISPAFPAPDGPVTGIPDGIATAEGWSVADAERSGLVNLARYRAIPAGAQRGLVLARLLVHSDRDRMTPMHFGFSDEGTIFLNGQPVFSGDNTYLSRSERYLGVVTVDNDAVYLPLRRGSNELVIAVSEAFGGWGLIARFPDLDGIRLEAVQP